MGEVPFIPIKFISLHTHYCDNNVCANLAVALGATSDQLLFGKDERGPDDEPRLRFEAAWRYSIEEEKVLKSPLDSMILTHEARRWSSG